MAQMVINSKERQQAFWKFLFFFLLSVAIILLAAYFDTRIPTKDNQMMRQQLAHFKIQENAQEKFTRSMNDARILIDSLRKPGVNKAYLNSQIADKIRELAALQYKDSSMYSKLNSYVIDVFQRYHEATTTVADMGDLPIQAEKLKNENAQLQRDLTECRQTLSTYINAGGY